MVHGTPNDGKFIQVRGDAYQKFVERSYGDYLEVDQLGASCNRGPLKKRRETAALQDAIATTKAIE